MTEAQPTESQRAGPLAGTRVLDISQIIAAPLAGMLLADMGADVVKVESPRGDRTRRSGSIAPGTSKRFQWLNRGKRSLVLDLERPEARELLYERLLPRFGVVINNFRLNVAALARHRLRDDRGAPPGRDLRPHHRLRRERPARRRPGDRPDRAGLLRE